MWDAHTPLTPEIQKKRIDEVVYIVKKEGKVAGVSTVHLGLAHNTEKEYYFFRTFIRPDIRGQIGTGFPDIVRATNKRMQEVNEQDHRASGMIVTTENPKLKGPGFRKLFRDGGWIYQGETAQKQDVWLYPYH